MKYRSLNDKNSALAKQNQENNSILIMAHSLRN